MAGRSGGADDYVGALEQARKLPEADRGATCRARQLLGAGDRPVRDQQLLRALRAQLAGGQLGHLAGADEEDAAIAQVAEQLPRHLHGHAADRHGTARDLRLGPHALRRAHRARERALQLGSKRASRPGLRGRFLHLPEDLGLAQHHRLEARSDPEEVAQRGVAEAADGERGGRGVERL